MEVAKSLRNGRSMRRAIIDIADIRRRAESDRRSRGEWGMDSSADPKWATRRRSGENDKRRMAERRMRKRMADSKCAMGRNQRGLPWGNAMEWRCDRRGDTEAEFQSYGRDIGRNEKPLPTKNAVPQNRRVRLGSSKDMKVAQGKSRKLLSK